MNGGSNGYCSVWMEGWLFDQLDGKQCEAVEEKRVHLYALKETLVRLSSANSN
jgi:hypothetical protein